MAEQLADLLGIGSAAAEPGSVGVPQPVRPRAFQSGRLAYSEDDLDGAGDGQKSALARSQ